MRHVCTSAVRRLLVAALVLLVTAPGGAAEERPAARGAVIGNVVDATTDQPIADASIETAGDATHKATTGADGKYRLLLAPGTYTLRVTAATYGAATVEQVHVRAGENTTINAKLRPAEAAGTPSRQQIDITAVVREASEATQLQQRKDAATVGDSVGAEAIAKSGDSDAGEVVARAPGITVKDNQFIIVRGLGERYSSALLNGSRLPSTDPNRRIVPLNIFPADFIEALSIIKTYSPDLPGDFAGGLVDIKLAQPPQELMWDVNVTLGFNTETTFQDYDTYAGYPQDWLTFGDGPRELPGLYDAFLGGGQFDPTTTQMRALVGSQPLNWNVFPATAPPNLSVDASVGDTWGPFGFNLAGVYGWKFQVRRNEVLNGYGSAEQVASNEGELFTYDRSTFETQLGAVLTTRYVLDPSHRFAARALVNRQGIDQVLTGSGVDVFNSPTFTQFATSSIYTANQLGMGQLEGTHDLSWARADWRASWAPSSQQQPDSKYYIYTQNREAPQTPILNVTSSQQNVPERTYSTLDELLQDYYLDLAVPFRTRLPFTTAWRGLPAQLKVGANYALRDRDFTFIAFRYNGTASADQLIDLTRPPDGILVPRNFATLPTGPLYLTNAADDPFSASQEIAAGYGMVELPLLEDRLRFIGGARLEYSYLTTSGRLRTRGFIDTILNDLDALPSANLIYSPRDDMNVRAVFSQTVSRPEFRELTPTQFPGLPGQRILQGNPELISSNITNYDLRWEWFFTPLELASVTFFYKDLTNPIELVTAIETSQLIDTYANFSDASLWGFELEMRKDLAFATPYASEVPWLRALAPALADVSLMANVSVIESETSATFVAPPDFTIAPVPGSSPLQGQPPYTVNAAVEYEHPRWGLFRLLYNTVGPTVVAKGVDVSPGSPTGILPNIESTRRDQLDLVWLSEVTLFGTPFATKLSVENVLNDVFKETQGPRVVNRYRTGLTISTGVTYSF